MITTIVIAITMIVIVITMLVIKTIFMNSMVMYLTMAFMKMARWRDH